MHRIHPIAAAQEAARATWQYRALEATRGNQTKLGTILIAVLGKAPSHAPRILSGGVITRDGEVLAHYQDRLGSLLPAQLICTVEELRDNFRGLAEHLHLTDIETLAMFAEVQKWIVTDERANALDEQGNLKETRH